MFSLKKLFLPETPLRAPLEVPWAELGACLGGGGRKETGLSSIVLLAQLLRKGTGDTTGVMTCVHRCLWLEEPEVTRQRRKLMAQSHFSKKDLFSTDGCHWKIIFIAQGQLNTSMALLSLYWMSKYLQKCEASKWCHAFHPEIDEESGRSPSAEFLGLGLASMCK